MKCRYCGHEDVIETVFADDLCCLISWFIKCKNPDCEAYDSYTCIGVNIQAENAEVVK